MSDARRVSQWDAFFFAPQSTSAMTLVRVGWGAVTAVWALTLLPDIDPFFTKGALLYERGAAEGAWNPLGRVGWEHAGLAVCLILLAAAVTTMVGFRTRLSSVVAVLCLISLQRANSTIFNSGDLLLRQVGIAVALAPCGLLWSVDAARARRRGERPNLLRAPYALRLLQIELALGYLLSAWTKSQGRTWHEGTAIALSLRLEDLQRFVVPDWLYEQSVLLNLVTWASLAFEATFAFLVWHRGLRYWVLGLGVLFHLGIEIFLDIGFFSIAVYLAYLTFLPTEHADRIIARVGRRTAVDLEEGEVSERPTEPADAVHATGAEPLDVQRL